MHVHKSQIYLRSNLYFILEIILMRFLSVLILKLILFIITVCSRACTCMCTCTPRRVWRSETVLGSGSSPSTVGPGGCVQVIRPDVCGESFTSRAALLVLYFNFSYLVELTLLSVSFVT